MIKKRSKMNNIIMWGLIATASVSLASVGFASWVINTIVPATSGNVNINVGAVETKSIKTTLVLTKGEVSFEHDGKGTNYTNGGKKTEDLTFAINSTFECLDTTQKIGSILKGVKFDFNFSNDLAALFGTEDANKYIEAPFVTGGTSNPNSSTLGLTFDATSFNYQTVTGTNDYLTTGLATGSAGDKSTFAFTTTFKFKWGAAFKNTNPASTKLDNTLTISELTTRLNAFKTATTGKTLNLNVTVTPLNA